MRTAGESHRPHVRINIDEREPHRNGAIGIERPVITILMPGSAITARWFEQRLVVVEPNRIDCEELRGGLSETAIEDDRPRRIAQPPDVRDLGEQPGIVVDALLRIAPRGHLRDDGSDRVAVTIHLRAWQEA